MKFGQVHHIEYYVNDLNRSNLFWDWFMPVLGYKEMSRWNGGVSWEHETGTYLVFVQVEQQYLSWKNSRQANGLNHIAFQGGSISELDSLQSQLEEKKIKILKRLSDYLCFEDPNEFAVEVYAKKSIPNSTATN
jgi:catechol-2,3-dioxygenase